MILFEMFDPQMSGPPIYNLNVIKSERVIAFTIINKHIFK